MTEKYLILIAGSPATGKSSVVNKIIDIFNRVVVISPDDIKEMYAELIGFSNLNEKRHLENKVWNFYYSILQSYMKSGQRIIISEYPFSMKQYDNLKKMSQNYEYKVLTIRLVAEFDTLWNRRYKRDRERSRHLSHIMKSYSYGNILLDRGSADNHISKSEFSNIIKDRKYDEFGLGKVFEVDMTNFDKVDYESIVKFIDENII